MHPCLIVGTEARPMDLYNRYVRTTEVPNRFPFDVERKTQNTAASAMTSSSVADLGLVSSALAPPSGRNAVISASFQQSPQDASSSCSPRHQHNVLTPTCYPLNGGNRPRHSCPHEANTAHPAGSLRCTDRRTLARCCMKCKGGNECKPPDNETKLG